MPSDLQEDDWEYEYDPNETETFLIDIDLSSLNHVIKSRTPGFRRNLQKPAPRSEEISRKERPVRNENDDDEAEEAASDMPSPQQPMTGSNLQILDLHTPNPIISHRDNIYSCTWSDMIGTNMFFSAPESHGVVTPQRSTSTYDLLGTSRIKLIAHKTKITPKPGTLKRGRPPNDIGRDIPEPTSTAINSNELLQPGKSLGNLRYNNASVNADIKRQARFLDKFMDVKKARGDTDNVRTVVTRQTVIANKQATRERTKGTEEGRRQALHDEIEKLNRRVVRGDSGALMRLQEIYGMLEDDGGDQKGGTPPVGLTDG